MAAPVNTVAPSFTGTLRALVTLTGSAGTWTGSPTFAYQWQRAEPVRHEGELVTDEGEVVTLEWEDISGATNLNYKLLAITTSYMVRLRVTGTNGDGSAVAYSEQDGPVATFVGSFGLPGAIRGIIKTNQNEEEN